MKKSSMRTLALTAILAGTVSIGGIMAYFTDGDTATNTFTVGKISLDLQEPSWVPPTNITPGQEIAKDPQIKNDGNNEEFVFLKVTVPYANVVTAN
ncbi:TasA family protein, partial [Frisingicoccus sp.]